MELLQKFKIAIGVLSDASELDDYYMSFLTMAEADLITDDIEKKQIESELGQSCLILYAKALMENKEPIDNKTILLLRNKLSLITKGERYSSESST